MTRTLSHFYLLRNRVTPRQTDRALGTSSRRDGTPAACTPTPATAPRLCPSTASTWRMAPTTQRELLRTSRTADCRLVHSVGRRPPSSTYCLYRVQSCPATVVAL